MVLGIVGLYFSIYMLVKLTSSKKKPVTIAESTGISSGAIPPIDSPEFEKWIDTPGNLEKLLQ